jgi:hypothetical protein
LYCCWPATLYCNAAALVTFYCTAADLVTFYCTAADLSRCIVLLLTLSRIVLLLTCHILLYCCSPCHIVLYCCAPCQILLYCFIVHVSTLSCTSSDSLLSILCSGSRVTNSCVWNTCVTCQCIDYMLPENVHDSVETCRGVLYAFFWVIPLRLNFIFRRFGPHFLLHLCNYRYMKNHTFIPTCLWRWNRQSGPKHQHLKFILRGIAQKKAHSVQITAKILNQECRSVIICEIFVHILIIVQNNSISVTPLRTTHPIYRVIQEESALLWEMVVWVIRSKKVHMNMGPILNGYGVMGIF